MQLVSVSLAFLASLLVSTFSLVSVSAAGLAPRFPQGPHPDNDGANAPALHYSHAHTHPEPLLVLNESDILLTHAPDPMSYWAHDFERGHQVTNWRGLMVLHVVGMSLAFFALLPVGKWIRYMLSPIQSPEALPRHCLTIREA